MRSTVISIILGVAIIVGVGYGGYYVVEKLRASADIETATEVDVDLNGDGTINALDLSMMTKAISDGSSDKKFDLNSDGKLNSLDLNVFLNNYPQR